MVLAQGNGWWHVSIDGYIGFMDSSFLTLGLHTAQDIAARNGGGAGGGSYAVVNNPKSSQALNLRQYASTASVVEAKLYNGTQLWVDEQGTEWSAVTVKNTGMSGYVMTRYLKLYNPAQPSHPAGGASGRRQLCESAHQPGHDLRADRRPGAHGQFRHDFDSRSGLVQGDVERLHRLHADLFPAAVKPAKNGGRAFQKSLIQRRQRQPSSQREHR